jgi:GT2 family glycosyltransferase
MDMIKNTSVVIVTYNHQDFIENCLKSVFRHKDLEVVVVDNNSQDETVDLVEKGFPEVKLIKNVNSGYGAGVNLGIKNSSRKYVVVLNPDTKLKENSIEELLKPLIKRSKLITTPKILCYNGSKINTCGNNTHFTGLAFTRGLGLDPKEFKEPGFVNGISGACFAIKREDYWRIGGFNENFFVYMEDTEFSWRAKTKGFKICYVPSSVVYHDYTLEVSPKKLYYLEKGRYIILREYLTHKELLRILPSLLMSEILTWGYAILTGFEGVKFKFKAIKDARKVEVEKKNTNGFCLIELMDPEIPKDQLSFSRLDKMIKRFANKIYRMDYRRINK